MNPASLSTQPPATPPLAAESAGSPAAIACWNKVGVYGTRLCPELPRHVHCRNCEVYSSAGAQLLHGPVPPGYRQEWTRHFAVEKQARERTNASGVIFRVDSEWLALPTEVLQEVSDRRPIHSLPLQRSGIVLGLANVRGELLICVALGILLQVQPPSLLGALRSSYQRLLVVNVDGNRLAFPVDEVHGPHRFHLEDLRPLPATIARAGLAFSRGVFSWNERTVGWLDAPLLFSTLNRNLA